jgi:hypothetical protein
MYRVYSVPFTHNRASLCQYSSCSATSVIPSCFCLIVSRWFCAILLLGFASFLHRFMPFINRLFLFLWNKASLLPFLKENSNKFLYRTFLPYALCQYSLTAIIAIIPLNAIVWMVNFTLCHNLNLPFPFQIVYACFPHTGSPYRVPPQKVHSWFSRWVPWCSFKTLFSPEALKRPGAGLF